MSPVAPSEKSSASFLSAQELALVVVTMVWGGTFLTVQEGLAASGPLFFVGARFGIGALLTALGSLGVLRGLTLRELGAGTATGIAIFLAYTLQAYGLHTISSSKSAFITALYVPLVPLFQWAILRRRPHFMSWIGVGFAFAGLLLLAGQQAGRIGLGLGEVLTLISAVAVAVEIVFISGFAGQIDIRRITVVQLGVTALLSLAAMPVMREPLPGLSWLLVLTAGGLGLATALIQLTMNWAQKSITPTRASVIYAGEPIWAGIVGRIAGERLPMLAIVGCLLIVVGVLVSELRPKAVPHAA